MLARWEGTVASTAALVFALVFGEAVIVAFTAVGRTVAHGANPLAWAVATAANAVAGFFVLGLTQIRAWESGARPHTDVDRDPRTRFAVRGLSGGGLAAFVLASVTGGPLAVGWFYGRRRDPRARSLTWTAAWLLAAVWSALYLGLLAWAF
ncbi:MAG: hypothetical protein QOI20_3011 [Acidimicrobiaceae bacterium]|nr:hypothetical protein [Acidimicrobiaceae bacterium]